MELLLFAKVGINATQPDDKSVLDVQANDKGLLIPRLTSIQRETMNNGWGLVQRMMIYYTNLDILFVGYWVGGTGNIKRYALNPWKTEYRTSNNTSVADITIMTINPVTTIRGVGMANSGNRPPYYALAYIMRTL